MIWAIVILYIFVLFMFLGIRVSNKEFSRHIIYLHKKVEKLEKR